jgi:hypothetical protein
MATTVIKAKHLLMCSICFSLNVLRRQMNEADRLQQHTPANRHGNPQQQKAERQNAPNLAGECPGLYTMAAQPLCAAIYDFVAARRRRSEKQMISGLSP